MTTGKDYGLPEEYADWVEVPFHLVNIGDNYVTTHFIHYPNGPLKEGFSIVGIAKYFVPPKPKPTLPDAKPGAVVSYVTAKQAFPRRAVKRNLNAWDVYGPMGFVCNFSDAKLLASADDDGFTVELEGL